jgi:diguanylate cyclase (GGDEF)-like protein
VWQNAWVAATYWVLAALVKEYFSRYQMWPAPLWVPAGLAMFAVFSMGRRCWAGIFLGSLFTNALTFGEPASWAAVISCGNTIAPIVAAELVRDRFRVEEAFARVSDAIYFCLAAFLHGALSGILGVTTLWAKGVVPVHSVPDRWVDWMLSDAGASLLVTPLLLLWRYQRPVREPLRGRGFEFFVSASTAMMAVVYLLFGSSGVRAADAGTSFLVLLPLLWMSVRLSLSLAYPVFVAVMGTTMAGTMLGYGPFYGVERGGTFVIFAQMTIGFSASVLLLGGASNQQRAASETVWKLNLDLEARVEQRTAELRETQRQLEKAAFYDSLTGLPNRRLLEERFALCGAIARRRGDRFGLLLIDLDRFKETNDNLGHDAGDALLVETGRRLTKAVRECDVVARIGGDEFVVLVQETGDKGGIEIISRRILNTLAEPVLFHGKVVRTSASIGVAMFPDHGASWQLAYKAADLALYEAKRNGRAGCQWYEKQESGVGF